MRVSLAAFLAILVLAIAGAPHVHADAGARGLDRGHECVACASGAAVAATSAAPDVAPGERPAIAVPQEPEHAPVRGAPLGAIPGQSPPAR